MCLVRRNQKKQCLATISDKVLGKMRNGRRPWSFIIPFYFAISLSFLVRFMYLVLESPYLWPESPELSNSPSYSPKEMLKLLLKDFLIVFFPRENGNCLSSNTHVAFFWAMACGWWQKYTCLQMPTPRATTGMPNSPARAFDTCVRKRQQLRKALCDMFSHVRGKGYPEL